MNARVIPPLQHLDRAAHLRHDLSMLEHMLGDRDTLLLPTWRDDTLVHRGSPPGLHAVTVRDAGHWVDAADELCFVGIIDGRPTFAVDVSNLDQPLERVASAAEHAAFQPLLSVGGQLHPTEAGIAAFSRGVFHFHRTHRHCGRCGEPTRPREGGYARYCVNADCGEKHFPRTDPAIIVLVTRGDRCLLAHQPQWPRGMYSTLAGFVEPGESLEQAVEREVKEEAGVTVQQVHYWKSQPWPFPASLMLAFRATTDDERLTVDGTELDDAGWYSRDELLNPRDPSFFVPPAYSVAGQLIGEFLRADPESKR